MEAISSCVGLFTCPWPQKLRMIVLGYYFGTVKLWQICMMQTDNFVMSFQLFIEHN